jgi:hypothetical protein
MAAFRSDPDDTTPVDPGYESSATSMFSGLPQRKSSDHADPRLPEEQNPPEQRASSGDSRLTASATRDTRGYFDTATTPGQEKASYEATEIFDQPSHSSKATQQGGRQNMTESRAPAERADSLTSLFPTSAPGMVKDNLSKPASSSQPPSSPSTSLFDRLQRYLPVLLILNALLLIVLILLLTLPRIRD